MTPSLESLPTHVSLEYKGCHKPDIHVTSVQGVVRRPDGTFIRPQATVPVGEELPKTPAKVLELLLKNYGRVNESELVKAWAVYTTVTTTESHHEITFP